MKIAPIVLFVYNRPFHTKKTLEALASNPLSKESILYIYADGAKTNASKEDLDKIKETRAIAKSSDWCGEIIYIERDKNYGLADSIIQGVTEIVNKYGKVIVLEDDIVSSPGFLQYMNDALNLYENEDKVMHISGYMFPVKGKLPETFFYNQTSCWGWATWKRAWLHFNNNAKELLLNAYKKENFKELDIDGTRQFITQIEQNIAGQIKTWAIKWHYSVFLNDGLCLHPGISLVQNTGLDGSGENCYFDNKFHIEVLADRIQVKKIKIEAYKKIGNLLKDFYSNKEKISPLQKLKKTFISIVPYKFRLKVLQKTKPEFVRELNENNRILTMPRFIPAEVPLLNKKIKVVDIASFNFVKNEIFDIEIYKFKSTHPKPYIIDCGANIGLSIIYFKKIFPDAEIVGFEPDKKVFEVLDYNIRINDLKNVTLINKGLWNESTTLRFFSEGSDGGRIAQNSDNENIIEIQTIQLREYLKKPVDFLKIDIEGAEIMVLEDCKDLLSNVKNLFVEYHSFFEGEQKLDQLLSILKSSGFRYSIQQHGIVSHNPFIKIDKQSGIDILLNISAYRL